MSKKKYPGVDEQALQQIARNFPSTAPIDRSHFPSEFEAARVEPLPVDGLDARAPESARVGTPKPDAAPLPPVAEARTPAAVEPVLPTAEDRIGTLDLVQQPATGIARSSRFPLVVSLLALTIASAPLAVPHIAPYAEQFNTPPWVARAMDMIGGRQSLPALHANGLVAQERSERAAETASLRAGVEDAKNRAIRLETSGSDLSATATRLDRIDEAVGLAHRAQLQAEMATREFAVALRSAQEASASTDARLLALEGSARDLAQAQASTGEGVTALRQSLEKLTESSANLGKAIAAIEAQRAADKAEIAGQVGAFAAQNGAALQAARADLQGKVDGLNEQIAKLGDALEGAVAIEMSRSAFAINEASERAARADERARSLEARLSTFQDSQMRTARVTNAVARLGAVVLTSEPFVTELSEATAALGANANAAAPLQALGAIARSGAPAQSKLREIFAASVGPQLRDLGMRYDASLLTRAYTLFSSQNGPTTPEGQRVWQVIGAAEKLLEDGDLANAIAQVARFEGPAGQIATDWLTQARKRVAADKAFAAIFVASAGSVTNP